jgi:CheY-like chemotaxis protein
VLVPPEKTVALCNPIKDGWPNSKYFSSKTVPVISGLLRRRFKEANILVDLHIATDGTEAVDFLEREADGAGKRLPDLILLDRNLPEKAMQIRN